MFLLNQREVSMNEFAVSSVGSIEGYISQIVKIPFISAEDEIELAKRFQAGCQLSGQKLATSYLRLVAHIARQFLGYGLPLEDLIQEGNVGLMKAIRGFDPELGFRLSTYAGRIIKSEIHDFAINNTRIIKMATTKPQRKLFFNLRGYKKGFAAFTEAEVNMIAEELNVSPKDVREMEQRLWSEDVTVSTFTDDDENDNRFERFFADDSQNPELILEEQDWNEKKLDRFSEALASLKPREQDIIASRYGEDNKITLDVLATKHGVSKERIRQLEAAALKKIHSYMS